jgi:hypothetical protein
VRDCTPSRLHGGTLALLPALPTSQGTCAVCQTQPGAAQPKLAPHPPAPRPHTCATLARLSELMSDDLPTLGRPTTPTVMAVLMPALRV